MFTSCRSERCSAGNVQLNCLLILVALCLLAPQPVRSQETETEAVTNAPSETETVVTMKTPVKQPVESEISLMAMVPDGNFTLWSATTRCHAWTVGVEYDRHSWGHLLKSQFDYVAEVIPVVILSQPAISDFWGNPRSPNQEHVPGLSLSPFGLRMLWRSNKVIKPYVVGKLGIAVFSKKAFSQNASYANFNIQAAFGTQFKLTKRVDLRAEPFEFFHVSNGYLAASNPGMDEIGVRFGISYHLGKQVQ